MPVVNGPSGVRPSSSGNTAVDLSHLSKTNPKLPELMKQNPGLRAFLEKHAATGSIATSSGGTASPVTWNAWFHSPASLHDNYNWKDQLIFVFQRGPHEKGKVDFGRKGSYQGRLIGVHRMGDLDVPVKMKNGHEGGTSSDGGFETQFPVEAIGKPGEKLEVCFCVGSLDDKGNAVGGWGTLGGYGGRQHDIEIGKPAVVPIHEDDGGYSVLTPKAGGGFTSRRI
jgi:hypothetical protein